MRDDLPEGYYLDNFEYLLDFVGRQYPHLLTDREKDFHRTFRCLSTDARKLFVRLSNRKGPYFRVDKLHYPEITSIADELRLLHAASFVTFVTPEPETTCKLCSKDELLRLDQCASFPRAAKKSALVEHLLSTDVNPVTALDIEVIEPGWQQELGVFKLLFFGNFHQDMTEFVMHELVAPFEQYELDPHAGLFRHREIVDELITLKSFSDLSRELLECEASGPELIQLVDRLPARKTEPVLSRRYDRIVNRVGRQLERAGMIEEAAAIYQKAQATPARERQARLLDRLGQPEEAVNLCSTIVSDPQNEEELEFAYKFGQRLVRKYKIDPGTGFELDERKIEQFLIQIGDRLSGESVELNARQYYQDTGYDSYYVENTLMTGLFGLCFWDVIYAPVSGAFFNPFQRGPVDLYTSDFADSRQDLITERIDQLQNNGAMSIAIQTFREKQGIANPFVNWACVDEPLLTTALAHMPVQHLVLIFKRLLVDLKNNTSGFPDLIVFGDSHYRMIEIKGPGDKIQKNQARWFRFFDEHEIPASLVNVEYVS